MEATELGFLAKACGGRILGEPEAIIKDVKIDSRACGDGDLFVCVVGEKNDGHNYIRSAYEQGCRAFLISKEQELLPGASYVLCENTEEGFARMADAYMRQFDIIRIAVTGSVGKTTTKMLTAAVMSAKYTTICTQKNLNTQLGNCLTAFRADRNTQAVVFEMGMDGRGQISSYVKWVKPQLAIITNVGISHMERLGSRDAIADAKLEVTEQFNDSCTLVVNAGSDYLKTEEEIRNRSVNKSGYKIVRVGKDLFYENLRNDGLNGIKFSVEGTEFRLPILGEHNALDACLAIACGKAFGIELKAAAGALAGVESTEKRLSCFEGKGIILLDDSYNASPDSMKAGISALMSVNADRRICVFGDMYELGAAEDEGHRTVGAAAACTDILIAVGKKKDCYRQGLESAAGICRFVSAENLKDAESIVLGLMKSGDAILVKGSNSTKVSEIAQSIRKAIEK